MNTLEKQPAFIRPLESQECLQNESIAFTCEVNKAGVEINWMKDGTILMPTEGIRIEFEGTMHKLLIEKAELQKAGTYTALISQGVESSAELVVHGILLASLRKMTFQSSSCAASLKS